MIIQSEDSNSVRNFENKYELGLKVIWDKNGLISDKCGIYSTPQAVILDKNSQIFFKGNYNKARFCTRKETRYVDMAMSKLIEGKALPLELQFAMPKSYGCSLPSDEENFEKQNSIIFNLLESIKN